MPRFNAYLFFTLLLIAQSVVAQLPDFTSMVKKNGDAVVNVSTTQKPADFLKLPQDQNLPKSVPPQMEDLLRHFFAQPNGDFQQKRAKSLGSGFIISSDGYILTNHHVVKDADEIVVKLKDRRQLTAKIIGSDERTDIALLKVEAQNLPIVSKGSSKQLKVGEWVLAIGSPFGFEQSVTAGIVSAKGRSLPGGDYVPFIQTDVAINPGNSGGPLFNMKGEVVGVNSQIYSRSGGYMGLSFAVPIDMAMRIVQQLKTKGTVSRGWLGVYIQDMNRGLAEYFNMDKPYGALITKVIAGSPSEQAGLQVGDIIIEFDGREIDVSSELPPIVGITPVGKKVTAHIMREGEQQTIQLVVGLLPTQSSLLAEDHATTKAKAKASPLGLVVADLTAAQRNQMNLSEHGVLVKQVSQGSALDAGIQVGDVILRIGSNGIRDVADFDRIAENLPNNQSIAVLVQRRGNPSFLALKIGQ